MTDIGLSGQASHPISYSDDIAERTELTTCYMCACRCGIKVHLDGDQIRYIEGNPDHPVNQGVLCGKGSAGIMQHNSPARLKKPLKRVGERGAGEFKEIEWDEAIDTAISWLAQIRATSPQKLAFFTGRDQPGADQLVGAGIRNAQLRGAWRLLLGQYGRRRHLHHGQRILGIQRTRLGSHPLFSDVRRCRGP